MRVFAGLMPVSGKYYDRICIEIQADAGLASLGCKQMPGSNPKRLAHPRCLVVAEGTNEKKSAFKSCLS
jgi:hypothetical protein